MTALFYPMLSTRQLHLSACHTLLAICKDCDVTPRISKLIGAIVDCHHIVIISYTEFSGSRLLAENL